MAETIKIGGELESTATGNKVADVANVKDKTQGDKSQAQINAEFETALEDRYTKNQTYSKSELNNMITTPNQEYVTLVAESGDTLSDIFDGITGVADTTYRVGNWDGSANSGAGGYDITTYSEYAYNGTNFVHLSTKTQIGEVFDISAYHATGGTLATYADLSAALDSNNGGGVPQSLQHSGMSVKFVKGSAQSPNNKYIQARCMAQNFTTDVTQWQGVDEKVTPASKNLAESGAVEKEISEDLIASSSLDIADFTKFENTYIGETGNLAQGGSSKWDAYKIGIPEGGKRLYYRLGNKKGSLDIQMVAFYNDAVVTIPANFMSQYSIAIENGEKIIHGFVDIPEGAKAVWLCTQKEVLTIPTAYVYNDYGDIINTLKGRVTEAEQAILLEANARQNQDIILNNKVDGLSNAILSKICSVSDFTKTENECIVQGSSHSATTKWDTYSKTLDGEKYFDITLGNQKGTLTVYIISFYTSNTPNANNIISDATVIVQDDTGDYHTTVVVPSNAQCIAVCNQKDVRETPVIDGFTYQWEKEEEEGSDDVLTWEQGAVAQSTGALVDSNYRVRCKPKEGNFELKVKDGYEIRLVASYMMDGTTYVRDLIDPQSGRKYASIQGNLGQTYRIVVNKTDGSAISPDDDFIDHFIGGTDYDTQVYDDRKTAVEVGYEYKGNTITEEFTSAAQIYSVWDNLMTKYPQYITRESIGTSRKVISFMLSSLDSIPMILTCNNNIEVGTTVYINGNTSKAAVVKEVYQLDSTRYYIKVVCQNGVDTLGNSGTLTDAGGNLLSNYSDVLCGKGHYYIDNNQSKAIDIAFVHRTTMVAKGAPVNESETFPTTGAIYDEDGNNVGSFSGCSVFAGTAIYCYTIEFSKYINRLSVGIKNTILYLGGVHGYERKAATAGTKFFEQLMDNWTNDKYLKEIRSAAKFVVIPCVNSFGINEEKNYNARGVDLNRNFSEGFETSPQLYFRWSGDSAFSEPESSAVRDKMLAVKDNVKLMIDFHGEEGYVGSYFTTPFVSRTFINGLTQAMSIFVNGHRNLPSYLFAWKNGSTVKYTNVPVPSVGDTVYNSTTIDENTVSAGDSSSITVNGVAYSRYSSGDVNYTRMFDNNPATGGMTTLYALSIGIRISVCPEVGSEYYLNNNDKRALATELIGNYIYAAVKYFMYV